MYIFADRILMEMKQLQQTLRKSYSFEGKGLHTGKVAMLTINPAPVNTGIKFRRTDISADGYIDAVAEYVSSTDRSTTLTHDGISVTTVEHLLSALTGMGIDNAVIDLDNVEVPILDGSAKPYIDAIWKDGIVEQDAPRKYVEIDREITVTSEKTGSSIIITPSDRPSFDVKIDFNSKVLGLQEAHWDMSVNYAGEVGVCRTFVFFHEIEYLFRNNLIKGGDVDNAIVIVEHPVSQEQLEHMSKLFNVPMLERCENGYLNNLQLRFPNECARHKLLDLIGDFRLVGGFLKADVQAVRSGHTINTNAAREVRKLLNTLK